MRTPTTLLWLSVMLAGCASTEPADTNFDAMAATLAPLSQPGGKLDATDRESFVDHAVRHRPELRASLERWRAARARIDDTPSQIGPLKLAYGFYASRVETRVGPQRHRASIQQTFAWPGTADRDRTASRELAQVDAVRHSSALLQVRWEVLDAYWHLWMLQQEEHWHHEHQAIARLLADTVRGRVEVGNATLADVGQAELLVSKTEDMHQRAARDRANAALRLQRAAGVDAVGRLGDEPRVRRPTEEPAALVELAAAHPDVAVWLAREEAAQAGVARVRSRRNPTFGVGVDWIETGAAVDPTIDGSGRDAVIGSVMLSVPIQTGEVRAATKALEAEAASHAANAEAARRDIETAVLRTLADIEESARRVQLYESTLVPQAEAVLGSVRGAYETGRSGVAALLLAQNDLLELQLALVDARGEHEHQWARLERLVGRPVAAQEIP